MSQKPAVNNFYKCSRFLNDQSDNEHFWYVEIIDRHEGKNKNNKSRLLQTFYFETAGALWYKEQRIQEICEATGCRAYMRLSPRAWKNVGHTFAKIALERSLEGSWSQMRHAYNHACGTTPPAIKYWLWDIDMPYCNETLMDPRCQALLQRPEHRGYTESRKGFHIITTGFDTRQLPPMGDILLHKDNPTNLYIPEENDKSL